LPPKAKTLPFFLYLSKITPSSKNIFLTNFATFPSIFASQDFSSGRHIGCVIRLYLYVFFNQMIQMVGGGSADDLTFTFWYFIIMGLKSPPKKEKLTK